MRDWKLLLGPMRLPFLILTPACVLLGLGVVYWTTHQINWLYAILALLGAVSAHISVNAFNEYFDFKSGLDSKTERTPFSGGSGTLPANPAAAKLALALAWLTLILTALIGVYFLIVWGVALLPLGLLGLVLVYAYTVWATRNPLICLIAPGLGFGTFMVLGTYFALTGHYAWPALIASFIPFFLVSDLLLLNQFPDAEADKSVGRRHYPITIGRQKSAGIYVAFLACAYFSLLANVFAGSLPVPALLGMLTGILALPLARTVLRHADDMEKLTPAMGQNVIINIATPLLMAIGLFLS